MLFPVLLTTLAHVNLAPPGDLYVDQSAANCAIGTGTLVDPVCTIPEAIALAIAGDTIHVAPGTYTGPVFFPFDLELTGTGGQDVTILDAQAMGSVLTIVATASGTVDGFTLRNGSESKAGGGILVGGNLTLRNSTVTNNETFGYVGLYLGGGGISALYGGSTVVIEQCSITDNFSDKEGGGIAIFDGDLTIRNSTIAGNSNFASAYRGGGVLALSSRTRITNTTISGNFAELGAALYIGDASPGSGVWSSTIVENRGVTPGIHAYQSASLEVGNSLIANSPYSSAPIEDIFGSPTSVGHNFISAASAGFVNGVNGDLVGTSTVHLLPHLEELADNGGLTQTHALVAGSLAIDAGNPMSFQPFDQRGLTRPDGIAPDIGAYEGTTPDLNLCSGDGGDQSGCTDCPCANSALPGTIGGCLNRVASSARLFYGGDTSVSLPQSSALDLRFALRGAPPTAFCILKSGDAVAPLGMMNPCFGLDSGIAAAAFNGLRCAVLNTRRHGGRLSSVAGNVGVLGGIPWGGIGSPADGIAQAAGFSSGDTRYFQVVYRDSPSGSCTLGLNTSQAIEIVFTP